MKTKIIKQKIKEYYEHDQDYRHSLTKVLKYSDILRQEKFLLNLIKNLDKHFSKLNDKEQEQLSLLVQHMPDHFTDKQRIYVKFLKEQDKPTLRKWIAMIEDRILVREGTKQLYGTQFYLNKNPPIMKMYPVINRRALNSRRMKMGLNSIEDHSESISKELKMKVDIE